MFYWLVRRASSPVCTCSLTEGHHSALLHRGRLTLHSPARFLLRSGAGCPPMTPPLAGPRPRLWGKRHSSRLLVLSYSMTVSSSRFTRNHRWVPEFLSIFGIERHCSQVLWQMGLQPFLSPDGMGAYVIFCVYTHMFIYVYIYVLYI